MAAGLGSRYGGLKQIAPVDEAGHVIMDFSIFDAVRAGFGRVVCVVKPENEREFREVIGRRVENHVEMRYAAQSLDMLPAGLRAPEGRIKPWGTGHAVLCARKYVDGPFAVINADDFYGRTAFAAICDFLAADGDPCEHAMVGYRLSNTLTENGAVSRGVCQVSPDGYLAQIVERTRIEARGGAPAYTEDGGKTFVSLPADATVSMNLWGFRSSILPENGARFCPVPDGETARRAPEGGVLSAQRAGRTDPRRQGARARAFHAGTLVRHYLSGRYGGGARRRRRQEGERRISRTSLEINDQRRR